MLGTTLCGRYKIVRNLGGGGFSQTFLAADGQLPGNPLCVVKQLKPKNTDPFTLQTARRLFDREARVLYDLGNHDQIPRLLAHLEEEQEFYLVQEFIEGIELKRELRTKKQLNERQVIALMQDILKILEFVHQQDVIHRDIKPSNLIRRKRDGKIVLIDFGAVKQVSDRTANSNEPTILTIAIGSPGYMPNEQIGGKPLFCSDIYAVGMLGIQALTGVYPNQLPTDAKTHEVVWQNLLLPDKLCDRVVSVSSELAAIIDKMVRYDYTQRYQSTTQVLEALARLASGKTPAGNPEARVSPAPPSTPPDDLPPSGTRIVPAQKPGLSHLDAIVDYLERHESSTRIKKLMFCACTGQWENDANILDNFKVQDLLQKLIESNLTLDQLSSTLYGVVQTLNRQTEYSLVAQIIIRKLSHLYPEEEELSQPLFPPGDDSVAIADEIVRELEQDKEALRIKKLMFCTCRDRWENDLTLLNNIQLQDLLQELRELNPTLNQLGSSLYRVVDTLNRKTEYSLIADKIIDRLENLYSDDEELISIASPHTETAPTPLPSTPQPSSFLHQPSERSQLTRTYNAFDIRREVMKYANPLRAKMLVFSIFHHKFDVNSREDWSALMACELDELLFALFCEYQTYAELESKLYSTAEYLDDAESSTQVANAIIRAMKSAYTNL